MHVLRRTVVAAMALSIVTVGPGVFSPAESAEAQTRKQLLQTARSTPAYVDPIEEAERVYGYELAVTYAAIQEALQNIVSYVESVQAEQAEQAREMEEATRLASQQRSAPQPASGSVSSGEGAGSGGGSVGACGGATNGADQYIQRESHGEPGVFNTQGSGAYGCYQIMPATWASSCSDLGPEVGSSPSTQAQCASRLPLSAWGG